MYGDEFRPRIGSHYYGDIVRVLFVAAAVIMIAGLPFFNDWLPSRPEISIAAIILLGLAAGFTNPRQQWILIVDLCISLVGTVTFGYFGIAEYQTHSISSALFWFNEVLAVLLLFALYYSAKSVRGLMNRSTL